MKWTDIRKLEVGDTITYGDSAWVRKCSFIKEGRILHVTVRGGIKVRVLDEGRPTDTTAWVCYAHVISFPRTTRKAAA